MALTVYEDLFIGGQCNNNCKNCPAGGERTFKSFSEILGEIEKIKTENVCICGGEPTLHPKIIKIIKTLRQRGATRIKLKTNGRMFCYPAFLKKILLAEAFVLDIKLFSSEDGTQNSMSRSDSARQVKTALWNIGKLKYSLCPKVRETIPRKKILALPIVIVRIPVMAENLHSLAKTVEFASKNEIERIILDFRSFDGDFQKTRRVLEGACGKAIQNGVWILLESIPLCLASGLEEHIPDIYSAQLEGSKKPACKNCVFWKMCNGVPENPHIEKEIKPVTKNRRFWEIAEMARVV
ncbi:MAG: radical SAM protein [Candidatus Diapherotrites archaeon]